MVLVIGSFLHASLDNCILEFPMTFFNYQIANWIVHYPPDMQMLATETVLKQAELIADELVQGV